MDKGSKMQFMKTLLLSIIVVSGLLVSCDGKTPDQYFNDAITKEQQGDFEGAIRDLDVVLERNPDDIEALVNRAVDKKALGRYDDAILDFEKALALDNNNILALYNRGNLSAEVGKYERALRDYDQAIKLKGGNNIYLEWEDNESFGLRFSDVKMEAILLQRGLAYAELSEFEKAFKDFSFCIEKRHGHDLAYLWRGVCYYNLGYPEKACHDWQSSKDLGLEEAGEYLTKNCTTS